MKGVGQRQVHRRGATATLDLVAVEEPLEVRVAGERVAITMRTPGDDEALALGFLFSEGLISGIADVGSVFHCGRPGDEGYGNAIDVVPAGGARVNLERLEPTRRGTLTSSACGVCGRQSIDDLMAIARPVEPGPSLSAALVAHAPQVLREVQGNFAQTGGVHAAAVLDQTGAVLASAEDVGRHNAVDKVMGMLLRRGLVPAVRQPGAPAVLVVSGRSSFEIIQKAAVARLAAVVGVSAASSLAIDLAERAGLTLATFVRGGSYNLYCHPERVIEP